MNTLNSITLQGNRDKILEIIRENRNNKIFFLKVKASIPLLVYLLNNSKIKKLIVLPSIHRLMSKKVLNALKKSGIKIQIVKNKIGRPRLDFKEIKKIMKMRYSDKKKIERLGISKRAFYYYKEKIKKNNE